MHTICPGLGAHEPPATHAHTQLEPQQAAALSHELPYLKHASLPLT